MERRIELSSRSRARTAPAFGPQRACTRRIARAVGAELLSWYAKPGDARDRALADRLGAALLIDEEPLARALVREAYFPLEYETFRGLGEGLHEDITGESADRLHAAVVSEIDGVAPAFRGIATREMLVRRTYELARDPLAVRRALSRVVLGVS